MYFNLRTTNFCKTQSSE